MNLSASPRDKWFDDYHNILSLSNAASSETSSSPITPRPSPATSCSHLPLDEDEVRKNIEERSQINIDIEQEPYKRTKRCSVIFECTWRGCFQRDSCQEVGAATYCVICGTCNKSFFLLRNWHFYHFPGYWTPRPTTPWSPGTGSWYCARLRRRILLHRDRAGSYWHPSLAYYWLLVKTKFCAQDHSNESFNESGSERSGEDHGENINIDVISQVRLFVEYLHSLSMWLVMLFIMSKYSWSLKRKVDHSFFSTRSTTGRLAQASLHPR